MSFIQRKAMRSNALKSISRSISRRLKSTAAGPFEHQSQTTGSRFIAQYFPTDANRRRLAKFGAFGAAMGVAQYSLGSATNFFDEKFVTYEASEDLADFYGTEDFMEIFCVFPFMVDFMMRGAEFDEEGNIHAWGIFGPGELEVSILFEEHEVDTDGDGEPDTLAWFNKKESFCDHAPSWMGGFKLWEMTQNFGYHRYDDGTCVVSHQGEKFEGFFLIRLLFQLHAKYVIWATERYINGPNFGTEDRETEMEEQRHNIPLHVFKEFLAELTGNVERAKSEAKPDSDREKELEVTIRRLKTLSNDMETGKANLPRLRTLRSHKTKVSHVQLVMDNEEAKSAIQTAVKQIESSAGQRDAPSVGMKALNRRTTMVQRNE